MGKIDAIEKDWPKATRRGEAGAIAAPMPGRIAVLCVRIGDSVQGGQEVAILEAMQMQNPVVAATAGVVKEICVKVGDPVQTGVPLVLLA